MSAASGPWMVSVAVVVAPRLAPALGLESVSITVLLDSLTVSSVIPTLKVLFGSPPANVRSRLLTAV